MSFHPNLFPVADTHPLTRTTPPRPRRPVYHISIDRDIAKETWIFVGGKAVDIFDAVRYNGLEILATYVTQLMSELDLAEYHVEEMDDDIGFYLDSTGHLSWIIEQCQTHERSVTHSLMIIQAFREANPRVWRIDSDPNY